MFERKRAAARLVYGVVLALVAVATMAATATAAVDEDELTDVGKTVAGLQKKMDELHERGGRAKKGELSAAAICGDEAPQQSFAAWGDDAGYVPAPGGDVESPEAWSLNKHVRSAENSPFGNGSASLFLGEKGEAISPPICISVSYPTIRLFAANTGGEESDWRSRSSTRVSTARSRSSRSRNSAAEQPGPRRGSCRSTSTCSAPRRRTG